MNPTLTFINGPPGSGKTRSLIDQALELYQSGVPSGQVLILCSSHIRQEQFRHRLLASLTRPVQELAVYTYTGFARNALLNVWPLAETKLQTAFPTSTLATITPDMVGVEESEALLRHLLAQTLAHTPDALEPLGQSNRATVNQLIRRQRIRAEHRIPKGIFAAHDTTLELPCLDVLHPLESAYDSASLRLRWLDGSRQLDVFHGLLERESWVRDWLATTYPYLLVDDGDESIPAQQAFLQALLPRCRGGAWLASDPHGGSRQGYLNAAPKRWQTLCETLTQTSPNTPVTLALTRHSIDPLDGLLTLADTVAHNWHQRAKGLAPTLLSPALVQHEPPAVCWLAMVDQSLAQLAEFVATGGQPGQLVWVVPDANLLTLAPWRFGLDRARIPYQILSGVQRPSAHPLARSWALLFQLLNAKAWAMPLASLEFAPLLATVLGWQYRAPKAISPMAYWLGPLHQQAVWQGHAALLPNIDTMPFDEAVPPPCREDVRQWAEWMQQHVDRPPAEQWWALYDRWIAPAIKADDGHALQQVHRSFERHGLLVQRLNSPTALAYAPWIIQVKAGVAADSPAVPDQLDPKALIIGTPQKVVDYEIRRPYQWWLDASSPQWHRTDEAPLYHMGLHANPNPVASKPTPEDTDYHRADRAGAITRLLIGQLPALETVLTEPPLRVFSAELDGQGSAQTGWLPGVLSVEGGPVATVRQGLSIPALRADQAPILAYRGGTMAISAVPGAGKTFVNVALILDRIAQGTPPDSILVLTYMDSAARTLQSRLKPLLEAAGYATLPLISTIHALALRLLSDAPPPFGLPPDRVIIDDITSEQLIKQVASQTQPPATAQANDVKDWARLLQSLMPHAKSLQLEPDTLIRQPHQTLVALGHAMVAYRSALNALNAMDFTDLIVGAVRVLEQDETYRFSVQQRFALIIEDEAQDSSLLMQRFLALLGGADQPNLIRTGDTNQSITTTFSTADTSVFRQFVAQAQTRVTMTQSGRCAEPIIQLANHWMTASAQASPALVNAFVPVAMVPVPGQNPSLLQPIQTLTFDTQTDERDTLVSTLARWQTDHPGASIAVLVRTNPQALDVAARLQQAGLPTVCFSQERQASVVLPVVVAWCRVLAAPHIGANRVALLTQLAAAGCYGLAECPESTLAQWRDFVAASPLFQLPVADLPTGAEALAQMVFDWRDWQRTADTPDLPQVLARMGERLFSGVLDRSNAYLVALQAQQFLRQRLDAPSDWAAMANPQALSILEAVTGFFEDALRSRKNLKQFTQEALGYVPQAGMVQVMTLHKSKGQEFEFVYLPFLTARNHPATPTERKMKEDEQLTVLLNQLAATGRLNHASEAVAQGRAAFLQAILEEEARLIYVGITRARRGLVLSTHLQGRNSFGRPEKQTPALAWQVCLQYLNRA